MVAFRQLISKVASVLSDYGLITDLKPICGWYYIQTTKNGDERIPMRGHKEEGIDLVRAVEDFRAINHIPIGNVEGDVARFILDRSPINDRWKGNPPKRVRELFKRNEIEMAPAMTVRHWLLGIQAKRPKLIPFFDVDARAEVCAGCIYNLEFKSGHKAHDEETRQRAINVRQRVNYDRDEELRFCSLHGILLRVAVFLRDDYLPEQSAEAPINCWLPETTPLRISEEPQKA